MVNETRDSIIAERADLATRAFDRMKGLLGRDRLEPGCGLVIEPCTSIHTFFMRFAIDVLFIDRNGEVIRTYESLPPWRITRVHSKAKSVIELPTGMLSQTGTRPGDRILFVHQS